MGLIMIDRTLDYINIGGILINILLILYMKHYINVFKKKTTLNLLNSKIKIFIDGILIIEFLFLFSLWNINEPNLLLSTIAENVKTFYFMSIIIITWKDIRDDASEIMNIEKSEKADYGL